VRRAPYRTVLVGFGAIAHGLSGDCRMAKYFRYATHAQVLRDHPRFDWCATVDPDPVARARARSWGSGHVAASLDGLDAVCAPEIAVIATPPAARLDVLRALPGLRGVIVEKPLGPDIASSRRFVAACEARDITVQVGLWRRGDRTLRRLAAGRAASLGRIQAGFGLYGNGLCNNGVHLVDLVRMQAGEVVAVRALGQATAVRSAPIRGDVALAGALELRSGAVVTIQPLDFAEFREVSLDLWGTKARRTFDQETLRIADYPRVANRGLAGAREIASDRPKDHPSSVGTAFYELYSDLAAALATGRTPCSGAHNALAAETIIAALLRSAARGGARVRLGPA
jgi:predicted dehydrogenase